MLPSLVLENQFGEVSNNFIKGGSSQISCNFVVDSTNGNGLGIRSLKSPGNLVKNVFMHTTQTPAAGNPNPEAGYILVELASPYAGYQGGTYGFVAPVSGTPINVTAGLTVGKAYVIVSVGTTTQAQWEALGLLPGLVPAVGQAFICSSATDGVGTGVVEVPATTGSGVDHIEVVGDPNQTANPSGANGASLVLMCVDALALTAPADNSVVGLTFVMIPNPEPLI